MLKIPFLMAWSGSISGVFRDEEMAAGSIDSQRETPGFPSAGWRGAGRSVTI
jgi:hypothetical protein